MPGACCWCSTHKPVNPVLLKARVDSSLERKHVRDVDALASALPAQETLELLGSWSTLMLDAIEGHGGLVTQIADDGMTAVFGAAEPVPGDSGAPWWAAVPVYTLKTA